MAPYTCLAPWKDELAVATTWMNDVVLISVSFDGSSITYADGTLVRYPVRTAEELDRD